MAAMVVAIKATAIHALLTRLATKVVLVVAMTVVVIAAVVTNNVLHVKILRHAKMQASHQPTVFKQRVASRLPHRAKTRALVVTAAVRLAVRLQPVVMV
jgi:hypothetical protein